MTRSYRTAVTDAGVDTNATAITNLPHTKRPHLASRDERPTPEGRSGSRSRHHDVENRSVIIGHKRRWLRSETASGTAPAASNAERQRPRPHGRARTTQSGISARGEVPHVTRGFVTLDRGMSK
jgi:hypothetical protein